MAKNISVQELKKILDTGLPENARLLDVRTPLEFNAGHIEGALNISVSKILDHKDELSTYETLYLQCQSGGRSELACELLSSLDAQLYNVNGGILEWMASGYQLVR